MAQAAARLACDSLACGPTLSPRERSLGGRPVEPLYQLSMCIHFIYSRARVSVCAWSELGLP